MSISQLPVDEVHWYMDKLTSRIVAESGIPSDRYHLGKIILQSLRDDPDFILQIDGATDEIETFGSALKRSVQCANAFKKFGLQRGDGIVLMAPNHIHLAIPIYAALYLGIFSAPIDRTFGIDELCQSFCVNKPKIIFCQTEKAGDVEQAIEKANINTTVITFDKNDRNISFKDFVQRYGSDSPTDNFKASDFDPEETLSFLVSTSGTTGAPKAAMITQKNFAMAGPYLWVRSTKFPTPTKMTMVVAPLQWLTTITNFLMPVYLKYTRLQSSQLMTPEHACTLINKYKPTFLISSPPMIMSIINSICEVPCDLSCFELIILGGSAVSDDLIKKLKKLTPATAVISGFGLSEIATVALQGNFSDSSGKPIGLFSYRIVDYKTGEEINDPNKSGELWLKGPSIFKGYYNNPEATKEALTEDGWLKTGDLFYRDERWNFYFVERIKSLLKYQNHQISPVELESVIKQHPGVLDVAVTGIPDEECGELPVACVVPRHEYSVTAQEIKDIVKESLTDTKQLRGGVVFMDKIPTTAATKVNRRLIKELVLNMKRE